jgi:regulator of protease activity HflC (stomatin/prohibitin superfamily)
MLCPSALPCLGLVSVSGIFWTPETQQAVVEKLERKTNTKDVHILSVRRGLTPIAAS